jgi:RNA polymerase sigma-70 factor (ECF subfamily)
MTPDHPPLQDSDEIELMRRLADDDEAALRIIVERYQGLLMNFFVRSGAESNAEDLVQETLVRLYRYRKKYRPVAKLTTFLHTLARHVWIDHVRKRGRWLRLRAAWANHAPDLDDRSAGTASRRMDAERLMDTLSEDMRSVVVLVFYQGLSQQDAAEVLGVPVGTIKSRLFNALNRMRDVMNGDTPKDGHENES